MRLTHELSKEVLESFIYQSEHEKALNQMINGRALSSVLPIHTAPMRMLDKESASYTGDKIRQTVIPAMNIYISKRNAKNGTISRNDIEYRITHGNVPFPLAHVYGSSGHLCLGSIFVPNTIPEHSPQQPLETLFLHNDRHVGHGNPRIPMTSAQYKEINNLLSDYGLKHHKIKDGTNLVTNDTLWVMGANLIDECGKTRAMSIMAQVFKLVFNKQEKLIKDK